LKPGKNPNYAASYRPISLLPILSKVLEKILLKRLVPIIARTIVNAPWYIPNKQLHTDLGISPVREGITNISHKYKGKLRVHPNELATTLLNDEVEPRRLKRFNPADLMKQHI
jgi:hypothetical protein